MAESSQATYTGIDWTGQSLCWVDDTHVVFLQANRMNLPAELARPKGLYLLSVTKPTSVQRLDLAPLPASIHEEIGGVSCQDQTIMFYRFDPSSQTTEIYAMRLGSPPELITKGQGWQVSVTGRYLLSSRPAFPAADTQFGRKDHREECAVSYLKADFTVLCWDFFSGKRWPLTKWVLADYQWEDTLTIRQKDGTVKRNIPNPTTPVLGKDGKPLLYGLHLRDLSGKIVATLSEDPKYRAHAVELLIRPDEAYVYAPCSERTRRTDDFLGVCRYPIDGQPHEWEEVFRFEDLIRFKESLAQPTVTNAGDVYFTVGGNVDPNDGIYWFDAKSKTVEQLIANVDLHRNEHPRVSPNGKWLLYVRSGKDGAQLMLLQGGAR